ncbi:unnamed protein product [Cercopithifilaria johnstoni]|uniref:Domain of unknown function DB domain-containing protein n=1 Tax=Cercopithifilaria johnstoni TaxID=2874296 RepID=A0A8J2M191_9BILA|nr:unnamed protein product [Cercopithifilaria johnstoni]
MFSKLIILSLITIVGFFDVICRAEEEKRKCSQPETDYNPCVTRSRADMLFRQCCQLYLPEGCHDLCQYETDENSARNILLRTILSGKCNLTHISAVLYCASQNQDNRKCCEHLKLADNKLGVGDRCLRFCDPAGQGIHTIARSDATCLFNLNVILYCHQSGIPLE